MPTKQKIIDISIALFAENGIKNVSVVKIAKKAGISRSGLYYHFKHGKTDIVTSILQIFEDCVRNSIPDPNEWIAKDADAKYILSKLFFQFEEAEAIKLRKITRIILSEMYYDQQVKQYAKDYFIGGRERVLAECFISLADNGLIRPLDDALRAARFLNSVIIVYAISDALSYPYTQDISKEQYISMYNDCIRFISYIMTGK